MWTGQKNTGCPSTNTAFKDAVGETKRLADQFEQKIALAGQATMPENLKAFIDLAGDTLLPATPHKKAKRMEKLKSGLTVCVTRKWAGVDNV